MKDSELELSLSMKAILMYEKMTGKAFSIMEDEEQVKIFMYCVFVCSTDLKITFPVFCEMLEGKKFAAKIEREFKGIVHYIQQFKRNEQIQDNEQEVSGRSVSMTEYINTLIFDYGVGIDYVMNKMELWELEAMYEAAEEHMHSSMEDKRLWAYLQMLPNFDKKHRNMTPEKFLPFPWDTEKHKKAAERELAVETERSKSILGVDLDVLLGKKSIEEKPDNEEISIIS